MEQPINYRRADTYNEFSKIKTTEELSNKLENLKSRSSELQNELYSHDADDKIGLETDYYNILVSIQHLEQEIQRRSDNN